MGTLASFLLAMVTPLLGRILVALGFSVVTFVGMEAMIGALIGRMQSGWGGLPGDVVGLIGLAGGGEALSIICGAALTRVAIWQLTRAVRLMGVSS